MSTESTYTTLSTLAKALRHRPGGPVRRPWRVVALIVAALTVAAACGNDTPDTGDAGPGTTAATTTTTTDGAGGDEAAFPVTVTAANGDVTIETRPERIVSLSPTATEILFAVGAGDQVVAVDDNSNYPPEAPTTDLSGFQPNVEAVAGYDPDLVILSFDPGDVVAGLEALGIPVLVHPAAETLDDTWEQIRQTGLATGHAAEAAELVADLQAELDDIVAGAPDGTGLTYYHELDPTFFTATSDTFIGRIYGLFGLENIADAVADGNQYPQLSAEYILEADPDLIFLADVRCCGQSAETVAARDGWDQLTAVRQGRVVELDDDIVSRWGPRIVEFARLVAKALPAT